MKVWKGTSTLDAFADAVQWADSKQRADVLLVGGKPFNLEEFPVLRGIFKTGIGTDNLPLDQARERGIRIGLPSEKTREVIYDETASFACQLILRYLYRDLGDLASWAKRERRSLKRKNLLVLGVGNIGARVVERMQAFCQVDTYDPLQNDPRELEALMRSADCITLHMPLTEQTRRFFDAEKLGWMPDGAALVNTARGPIVCEDALFHELQARRLFAAFDVFWSEPYEGKLKALHPDPFYMTPHVASTCKEFLAGTADDFRRFLRELNE